MKEKGRAKGKKGRDALGFGLCCIIFYALGSYLCHVSRLFCFPSAFCPVIGKDMGVLPLFFGWLFVFLPLGFTFLCGYGYLGDLGSAAWVGLRGYLSGYSCYSVVAWGGGGAVFFAVYTVLECLILLVLVSMAVEQRRFRWCYTSAKLSPFKIGVARLYFSNFAFRVGILFFVFILRTVVCSVFYGYAVR